MVDRPNAIIFGGMDSLTTTLVHYLIPGSGEPLIGHLLVVDKYSIHPPTTFVPKGFIKLVEERSELIEYKQANLQHRDVVCNLLSSNAPNGRPYGYIFDISGDLSYERPASIHIAHTFEVALSIAQEAAKREHVKAYVRITGPFHMHNDLKKRFKEEDEKGWKPWGQRGVWWTEMIRALGKVEGLPLVVLRCGIPYGPGTTRLEASSNIVIGLVYKSMGKEMKFLWSPKLKKNTIHSHDLITAVWKAAEWIAHTPREQALSLAGVSVPPTGDKEVENVPEAVKKSEGGVMMPLFNIVDDGDTTQESMAAAIGKIYGVKVGFLGNISSMISGMRMETVAEDINELHMEEWARIITTSEPPVPNTPLSPYAQAYILEEHGCALDGEKAKKILGVELKYPRFDENTAREFIDWCRAEGIWPESLALYQPLA